MNTAKKVARNSLALIVSQVLSKGLLFLWTIMLARWLRPEGFGQYSYILALVAILGILSDYGLGTLVTRNVARKKQESAKYLTNVQALRFILSTISYVILIAVALLSERSQEMILAIAIFGITVFTSSAILGFNSILNAFEKMHLSSLVNLLLHLVCLSLGYVFIRFGTGLVGAISAWVVAGITAVLAELFIFKQHGHYFGRKIERAFILRMLKDGFPFAILSILGAIYVSIDTVILKTLQGLEAAGIYNAAYKLVLVFMIIPNSIVTAVFPLWSQKIDTSRPSMEEVLKFLIIVSLPLALLILFYSDQIILKIYGDVYIPAITILKILAGTLFLMFLTAPFAWRLIAEDQLKRVTVISFFVTVFNIILNFILIPRYSFRGAAMVTLLSEAISLGLLVFAMGYKVNYGRLLIRPFLAALVLGGCLWIFKNNINIFIGAGLAIVIYVSVLFLVGTFDENDKELLGELFRSKGLKR